MATLTLTWHTLHGQGGDDGHVCPICKQLDNYNFVYNLGAEEFEYAIMHPTLGTVWDIHGGSEVHQRYHMKGPCRCTLTYQLELKDLLEKVLALRDVVANMVSTQEAK